MIPIGDIYDKDVNFLFGSGASFGLLPTLRLALQGPESRCWSLEDLATHLEGLSGEWNVPLFMHYYASCVRPAQELTLETARLSEVGQAVMSNYRVFLETVLAMLQRRRSLERRCNLFTTNYDGCFPLVADELLREGSVDFVLNDGTRGFTQRFLEARNFSTFLCQTGVFDRHQSSIPQINLIHLHGSVYWRKSERGIRVEYGNPSDSLLDEVAIERLRPFSEKLADAGATWDDVPDPGFTPAQMDAFWTEYQKIPIVNPTKWKFHETVYEEHYYQMLRLLSYELEKPNAVLITFGFSFADEHILNLVKRSLSNPHLQVFVCCFDNSTHVSLTGEFRGHRNVQCLKLEGASMDFAAFNSRVFTSREPPVGQQGGPDAELAPGAIPLADGALTPDEDRAR